MNHTLLILMYTVTMFVAVVQSLSHVQLFVTSWTLAHQAPLSMGFPRQEYWSELHFYFLLQGIFPAQESNQDLLHCRQILYQLSYQGIPVCFLLLPNNIPLYVCISSVQLLSHVRLFATPWTAAHQASLSITNSQNLPKLMSIESVMTSNHLILCHPLLLLPSIFPSIRDFSNESVLRIRWPKYWSFSFSISPSNEYSGLISFRMAVGSPCYPRDSQEYSPTPQF